MLLILTTFQPYKVGKKSVLRIKFTYKYVAEVIWVFAKLLSIVKPEFPHLKSLFFICLSVCFCVRVHACVCVLEIHSKFFHPLTHCLPRPVAHFQVHISQIVIAVIDELTTCENKRTKINVKCVLIDGYIVQA